MSVSLSMLDHISNSFFSCEVTSLREFLNTLHKLGVKRLALLKSRHPYL